MPTIDTSYYYVIKNLFAPGRALTNVSGGRSVQLTPGPPTTWAQLWTELWAFQPLNDPNLYMIKCISGGSSYLSFAAGGTLTCLDVLPRFWSPSFVNYTPPAGTSGDPVATFATAGGNAQIPTPSNTVYLAYSNSGSNLNYANVIQSNSFSFLKFWQLTKTAIPV